MPAHRSRARTPGSILQTNTLLLYGVPACVAVLARLVTGPHPIDDAYITFRYARNLALGDGLVYNPGEWVLGTTTPVWACVLAIGYRLGATDLPALASALSAVCDAVTAAILARLSLSPGWRTPAAVLMGVAWAINPMSIAFSSGGMETSLFVMLTLLGLAFAGRGRASAPLQRRPAGRWLLTAGLLAGLAANVRPEGMLLAMVVVAWTWIADRSHFVRVLVATALPIMCAWLVLFALYGTPIPNSIAAKQVAYRPSAPFENLAAFIVQAGLPGWSTYLLGTLPGPVGLLLVAVGLATLLVLLRAGLGSHGRRGLAWQPFVAFGTLYVLFFAAVGLRGVRLFPWYLVPIEPFYLLAAAAGLARLGWRVPRRGWLPVLLVAWQLGAVDLQQPFLPRGHDTSREALLLQVGQRLAESLSSDAVVAAPEIGAVGYASRLHILDTTGLVSPTALAFYPLSADELVTDNAVPAGLIHQQQPDAVVALDAYVRRTLVSDPSFRSSYRLDASYPAPIWQSQYLLVFRRDPHT